MADFKYGENTYGQTGQKTWAGPGPAWSNQLSPVSGCGVAWNGPFDPNESLREQALRYRLKLAEARAMLTAYFTVGETSPAYRDNLLSQLRDILKESP